MKLSRAVSWVSLARVPNKGQQHRKVAVAHAFCLLLQGLLLQLCCRVNLLPVLCV
jgi:hypothetical protein